MTFRLLLFLMICSSALQAAMLSGTVMDESNAPLSFANVYIQGTTIGTTTNEKGRYHLDLQPGEYQIVFNYIGYRKHAETVVIGEEDVTLNVVLSEEEIKLKEVVVSASEDPAYAIIRKAIAQRQFHYDQVESYHCFVYVKGMQRILSAPDKVFGFKVNMDGSLDSNNAGIVYLSESISEYTFEKPDKIKETMISSKVSGNSQGFSWNRIGDLNTFNFYKNTIKLDFLSDRVFISPIADNAMLYYKYRLEGFFEEDGYLINKIEVIPRRENDPVFRGYIYIVENLWNIHSLEFLLTQENQIKFIDSLQMEMVYLPVPGDSTLWMPVSQHYQFKLDIFQIKAKGNFGIIYKDYTVNKDYNNRMFTNEVLHIDEEANQKDEEYWKENRPVPLTEEEAADYERKDSLEELRNSKEYLRKIDKEINKFGIVDVVLGYFYQNSYRKFDTQFRSFLDLVQYNTVEGLSLRVSAEMIKHFEGNKELHIEPALRYGFSLDRFQPMLKTTWNYDPKRNAGVSLRLGQYIFQFNREEEISEIANSFYTLFIEKNYMKIFQERFIQANFRSEIANGLMLRVGLSYARRMPLENHSFVRVKDRDHIEFTSNVPRNPSLIDGGAYQAFNEHDAAIFNISLRWRPGQKYLSRPDQKIIIGSKYPEFTLAYRKSVPGIFKSDLNFDYLEFKITDEIPMKLFGNATYIVKLGMFVNDNRVEFMDYKHFFGNLTHFGRHYLDGFQMLDYYSASTSGKFIEAHFQHNFDGFLFNKIPFVRKAKFQALVGAHFLYTEEFGDYTELDVGIENILRVLRVDFITGFKAHQQTMFGFRVGVDMNLFN